MLELLLQAFVHPLLGPIGTPLAAALVVILCPERWRGLRCAIATAAAAIAGLLVLRQLSGGMPAHSLLASDSLSALCALGASAATLLVSPRSTLPR